jgi:tetratricopeptide (TPR) repeat protein
MAKHSAETRHPWAGRVLLSAVALALALSAACGGASDAERATKLVAAGLRTQASGKTAEAGRDYREALVYDPTNKFAYYNLGLIAQTAGIVSVAELQYKLALTTDPAFIPALFNLGTVLSRTDPAQAAVVYQRLIAVDPGNAPAHLNLGFALRQVGRTSEARKEFTRAVALDPTLRRRIP